MAAPRNVDKTVQVLAEEMSNLLPPVKQLQVTQIHESRAICRMADGTVEFGIGDLHANEIDQ